MTDLPRTTWWKKVRDTVGCTYCGAARGDMCRSKRSGTRVPVHSARYLHPACVHLFGDVISSD